MDYRPSTPGTTTSRLGYHDVTLGVPSEWTLLNVHTIKDKSRIFYFDLILIVNIMNNYFTYFCKSKMSFYDTKTLTMVFYYLGGNRFFSLRSFMWLVYKLVHITTPIGHEELDPIQQFTLGGPRSLVIEWTWVLSKKGTHTPSNMVPLIQLNSLHKNSTYQLYGSKFRSQLCKQSWGNHWCNL